MRNYRNRLFGRTRSLAWAVLIRILLYLVIFAFYLQHIHFAGGGRFERPGESLVLLTGVCFFNLALLLFGADSRRFHLLVVFSHVFDVVVLTRVVLFTGGFHSILVPYYLPILVIAPAWLPRRFTATFPSTATLGVAYIGSAHLLLASGYHGLFLRFFPEELLGILGDIPPPTIVSNMLLLTVLFFVVSYLSGFLSDRFFFGQRLNREILASMKEGVAVVDSGRRLLFANDEFIRIFGKFGDDGDFSAIQRMMFPEEDGEAPVDIPADGDARDFTAVTREADAALGLPPMEIRVSAISLHGEGSAFGLVFLVSDLSVRRRMERFEREIAHFSSITTMAAGLAHEIRNPLASLRSAMQEIGEAFPKGSQNRTLTDIVISESDRLDGVIGRFLDFSREGKLRLARRRLAPILEDTRTLILRDKEPGALEVTLDVRKDPEVVCDPDRLREVFLNLALNASQAAPPRGGKLDIVLDEKPAEGLPGVEVLFLDNGPGIADDAVDRIFDPFFTRREGGTGMGLPLSRKQASMHGGEITVSNREGGGAAFRVWIPLRAALSRRSGDTKRFSQRQIARKK